MDWIRKVLYLCALICLISHYSNTHAVSGLEGVEPVKGFDAQRYLGKWYEIARLDNRFERGLSRVTAEYSWRENGGIQVINKGYNTNKGTWSEVEGKAFFVEKSDTAFLKVSFFWIFYSAYVVFELDQDDYQYALVAGDDVSYLWLLARTPTITDSLRLELLEKAENRGFEIDQLIWVDQSPLIQ